MKFKGFLLFIIVFQLVGFHLPMAVAKKFDDKGFTFFEWGNPTPRFSDLGLNVDNVQTLIGNSQLLIYHKGRDIKLWTDTKKGGEIQTYNNARFVSSLAIFNKPRKEVIDFYLNFDLNFSVRLQQLRIWR